MSSKKSKKIQGTNGNDVLVGTDSADEMDGKKGNDQLYGDAGNDVIAGNKGDDSVYGGDGDDVLYGGAVKDKDSEKENSGKSDKDINKGEEDDKNKSDSEKKDKDDDKDKDRDDDDDQDSDDDHSDNDFLDGGAGNDRIYAGAGNDTVHHNVTESSGASDVYSGDSGIDTLQIGLNRQQWLDPRFQADLTNYLQFLADHTNSNGKADNTSFQFSAFDLQVSAFENLQIQVDGVVVDPADEAVLAKNDLATIDEEGTVTGNVLIDNGFGEDEIPDFLRTVSLLSGPASGSVILQANGDYSYTPGPVLNSLALNETATDSFSYLVEDADGDTSSATVTITITGINDAPVASSDSINVAPEAEINLDLLANDSDVDGDTLRIEQIEASGLGVVTLNDDGTSVRFVAGSATGFEELTYTITDSNGGTSTSSVLIVVTPGEGGQISALGTDGADVLDFSDSTDNLNILGGQGDDTITGGAGDDQILWSAGDGNDDVEGGAGWDHMFINMGPDNTDSTTGGNEESFPGYSDTAPTDYSEAFAGVGADLPSDEEAPLPSDDNGSDPLDEDIESYEETYSYDAPADDPEDGVSEPDQGTLNVTYEVTVSAANGKILVNGPQFDLTLDGIEDITITGGEDSDLLVEDLTGTDIAQDTLYFNGGAGNNVMDASRINSTRVVLKGLGGNDILIGTRRSDTLEGGTGNDVLDGGDSNDHIDGGVGIDTAAYVTSSGAARADLGAVYGTVLYGTMSDRLFNIENLTGSRFGDQFWGNAIGNRIDGRDGNDTIDGRDGNDLLIGGNGNDTLIGGTGNDILDGQAGNDTLRGGSGDDRFFGGTGVDLVSYAEATVGVKVTLDDALTGRLADVGGGLAKPLHQNTGDGYDLINRDIEGLIGSAFTDYLYGSSGNDTLNGAGGSDLLRGKAGDDLVIGGDGNDRLWGDAGNDRLFGENGNDIVAGGDGNDLLVGGHGDDSLYGGEGNDVLDGGTGYNQLFGDAGDDRLELSRFNATSNLNGSSVDGGTGVDTLVIHLTGSALSSSALRQDLANLSALMPSAAENPDSLSFTFTSIPLEVTNIEAVRVTIDSRFSPNGYNQDPSFGPDSATAAIAENETQVSTLHATDAPIFQVGGIQSYSPLRYLIHDGPDASLFDLDTVTGALSFRQAPDYELPADANGDNVYQLTVVVHDSLGGYDKQDLSISVGDVIEALPNQAPVLHFALPTLNLLDNGSFEGPAGQQTNLTNGLESWNITSGDIDIIRSFWPASDGAQSLDLNGSQAGSIAQTFATVAGMTYRVDFDLSKNGGEGSSSASISVSADGQSQTHTYSGASTYSDMLWDARSFTFVADSSKATLAFSSLSPSASGPALDNVRVWADGVVARAGETTALHGLQVSDVDAGVADLTMQLNVSHGSLQLGNTANLQVVDGDGSDGSLVVTGSQAALNAVLASAMSYTSALGFVGADTLSVTVSDNGNTGSGGALSSSLNVPVIVERASVTHQLTNLVDNGSFESPNFAYDINVVFAGSSELTSWNVSSGSVDVIRNGFWQAAAGSQSLDLNGNSPASISQALATSAGKQYSVIFSMSKNTAVLDTATIKVSADSSNVTHSFSSAVAPTGMNWATQRFDFTATDSSTLLEFTSLAPGGASGPALDNVLVVERQTLADFRVGLGGDVLDFGALLDSLQAPRGGTAAFDSGWLDFDTSSGTDTVIRLDTTGGGDNYVDFVTLLGVLLNENSGVNYLL